jgi:hypothetical protein
MVSMAGIRLASVLCRAFVVGALLVPAVLVSPAAAADGTIAGTVTLVGSAPIPGTRPVVAVRACPQGDPGPDCLNGHDTSAEVGTGNWSLTLPPGEYDLYVVTLSGAPLAGPRPVTIPDGAAAPNEDFEVALAVIEGRVTRNGAPFPEGSTGVGACPTNETGPLCPSLQLVNADASGAYAIALPPGDWRVGGFHGLAGGGGVAFSQEALEQTFADGDLVAQNFNVLFGFAAGSVTVNGNPAGAGVTVAACREGEQGPFCPSLAFTTTSASGNYELLLLPGDWNVGAVVALSVFGPTQPVTITDGVTSTANLVVDFGTVTGTVTDTNGAVIQGDVFVGACPGTGPASPSCPGLNATQVSTVDGSYSLLVEPGIQSVGAVEFTSGVPGPFVGSDTAVVVIVAGATLTCNFAIGGGTDCENQIPQTKDDCKKGGWQHATDNQGRPFKNQGDCVSFVATNGKNPGAG